eukprot:gene9908-10921_t
MKTLVVLFLAVGCVWAATGEGDTEEEVTDFDEPIHEEDDGELDDIEDDNRDVDEDFEAEIADENNPYHHWIRRPKDAKPVRKWWRK